jgi:hypothetical protein
MSGATPFGHPRPIGWVFNALLAIPILGLLWSFTGPGFPLPRLAFALFVLAVFGVIWAARLTGHLAAGGRQLWPFLIGPVALLTAAGLIAGNVPERLRWAASRPAFDQFAGGLAANPGLATPQRLGLYSVDEAQKVPGGWIVYEDGGTGLFDDAGFAYLPGGPTPNLGDGSWEGPQFRHLGGPWYAWTASW